MGVRSYIIVIDIINKEKLIKRCFNLFGGFIGRVEDIYDNGVIKRYYGNKLIIINKNQEIEYKSTKINFSSITNARLHVEDVEAESKKEKGVPNVKIGVLDLEAYEDKNSINKAYAIGFYTYLDEQCNTYYIDKSLDNVHLVHTCINEMLRDKYKDITFYCHNFARYDSVFIYKYLSLFNESEEGINNPYILDPFKRDQDMIRLIIKRKINGKMRKIKILDSLCILPHSLAKLCKDYKVAVSKGHFPHGFSREETLFYIGTTPSFIFYRKHISYEQYQEIKNENWNFKAEAISYLEKDLICLYQVLKKVNLSLFIDFNVHMTDSLTASGLALNIFMRNYYDKENKPIPLNKPSIYWDIKSAYFGGRTEVYKPYAENSYHYDVNSLYPFTSLNPMPGLHAEYIESYNKTIELESDLFRFFYCKIKTTNNYLGLLPIRVNDRLIFPNGEWCGWYFSEQLKFAKDNGYQIEVVKGYKFNKVIDVFKDYVNKLYEKKSKSENDTERNMGKIFLNALIGLLGMYFNKPVTKQVDIDTYIYLSKTRIVTSVNEDISENSVLITYYPEVNKEKCEKFGVDYIEALNASNIDEGSLNSSFKAASVAIPAAVTSYARIHMSKLMLDILNKGGQIYYTDTDSIVTDKELPKELVDSTEIGKLKLVHKIIKAYFISNNTYILITADGQRIKKSKTVDSQRLSETDYVAMYWDQKVSADKISSYLDYGKGSVKIMDEIVELDPASYSKRENIYDK